jgi:hypothetical protein
MVFVVDLAVFAWGAPNSSWKLENEGSKNSLLPEKLKITTIEIAT